LRNTRARLVFPVTTGVRQLKTAAAGKKKIAHTGNNNLFMHKLLTIGNQLFALADNRKIKREKEKKNGVYNFGCHLLAFGGLVWASGQSAIHEILAAIIILNGSVLIAGGQASWVLGSIKEQLVEKK